MDFTSIKICSSVGLVTFTLVKYVYHKLSHFVKKLLLFWEWHVPPIPHHTPTQRY